MGCGVEGPDEEEETAAIAEPLTEVEAPPPKSVTFARDTNERVGGVHIRDAPHHGGKVVYSVRLLKPGPKEELRLRAEVTLSRCNPKDIFGQSGDGKTACTSKKLEKDPYGYTPRLSARLVLGSSAKDIHGKQLSKWFDMSCHDDTHHCSLTIPEIAEKGLPTAAEKFVNLVVTADADGHDADAYDVMDVEKGHGALYVTRLGPGATLHALHDKTQKLLAKGKHALDLPKEDGGDGAKQLLVHQIELEGLQHGDVIDVDARMRAVMHVHGVECAPLVTGKVILTEAAGARKSAKKHDADITFTNGRNCRDDTKSGCVYTESGAVRVPKGAPSKMFVSYVARSLKSCVEKGDKWHIDPDDGFLEVNVRR